MNRSRCRQMPVILVEATARQTPRERGFFVEKMNRSQWFRILPFMMGIKE